LDRKRNHGPRPIGLAIKAILREAGLANNPRDQRVFRVWNETLGSIAPRTQPVRFFHGELVVEVDSAVHLQELQNFTGEGYRRKLNRVLKNDAVRKLTFRLRG